MANRAEILVALRLHVCDDAANVVLDYAQREPTRKINDWIWGLHRAAVVFDRCDMSGTNHVDVPGFTLREYGLSGLWHQLILLPYAARFCSVCRDRYTDNTLYDARCAQYGRKVVCFRKHSADMYYLGWIDLTSRDGCRFVLCTVYEIQQLPTTTDSMRLPKGLREDIRRVLAEW